MSARSIAISPFSVTPGAPAAYCVSRRGFHYSEPDYTLPLRRLTGGEVLALFLAARLMAQYAYARDLAAAFAKLTAALPDEVTLRLDHLQESFQTLPAGLRVASALVTRALAT